MKFVEFADEEGDFFFLDNLYRKYLSLKTESKKISKNKKLLKEWVIKNDLNFKTLHQSCELIEEITKIIASCEVEVDQYKE